MSENRDQDIEDESEPQPTSNVSEVASELKTLQNAVETAARERSKLPQPLFWSLFHSEIKRIKAKKATKDTIRAALERLG